MTLEEKRELVAQNKESSIAAMQAVIDTFYNILNPVLDGDKIKEEAFKHKDYLSIAKDLQNDVDKFEKVLMKIKKDEFLEAKDIAYLGICYDFCAKRAENQISTFKKAKTLCLDLAEKLSSNVKEFSAENNMCKLIQKYNSET